jgi:hypothetical protein
MICAQSGSLGDGGAAPPTGSATRQATRKQPQWGILAVWRKGGEETEEQRGSLAAVVEVVAVARRMRRSSVGLRDNLRSLTTVSSHDHWAGAHPSRSSIFRARRVDTRPVIVLLGAEFALADDSRQFDLVSVLRLLMLLSLSNKEEKTKFSVDRRKTDIYPDLPVGSPRCRCLFASLPSANGTHIQAHSITKRSAAR